MPLIRARCGAELVKRKRKSNLKVLPVSGKMNGLQALPTEIFNLAIEHLVITIGIQKAILLRTVNRAFDAALLHAICISQVVDIEDPATSGLACDMNPRLRGKIILVKSRSLKPDSKSYVKAVATVNRMLDSLIHEPSQERADLRHACIAEAVIPSRLNAHNVSNEPQNLLSAAAVLGDLSLVKLLLDRNRSPSSSVDINGTTPHFGNPLALAAARGHLEVVRHLLESGARIDYMYAREEKGCTELADWNRTDGAVRTWSLYTTWSHSALSTAISGGHMEVVDLLLRPEHRPTNTSLEYLRAIMAGVRVGRLDVIEALFELIGQTMSDFIELGQHMLWEAVRHDQSEVVLMLLDNGEDVNTIPYYDVDRFPSALSIAASLGNIEMARLLLERGANAHWGCRVIHTRSNRPIERAALRGHQEVVELLIEYGADPALALSQAAFGGQCRVLKYLLSRFPDFRDWEWHDGGTVVQFALLKALTSGNAAAFTILAEDGVPDAREDGLSHELLMNCAKDNYPWMVQHLTSRGVQDINADTPPHPTGPSCVRKIYVTERTWQWVSRY